jgi:hypothetical protein
MQGMQAVSPLQVSLGVLRACEPSSAGFAIAGWPLQAPLGASRGRNISLCRKRILSSCLPMIPSLLARALLQGVAARRVQRGRIVRSATSALQPGRGPQPAP